MVYCFKPLQKLWSLSSLMSLGDGWQRVHDNHTTWLYNETKKICHVQRAQVKDGDPQGTRFPQSSEIWIYKLFFLPPFFSWLHFFGTCSSLGHLELVKRRQFQQGSIKLKLLCTANCDWLFAAKAQNDLRLWQWNGRIWHLAQHWRWGLKPFCLIWIEFQSGLASLCRGRSAFFLSWERDFFDISVHDHDHCSDGANSHLKGNSFF